jgi:hypothetical protein
MPTLGEFLCGGERRFPRGPLRLRRKHRRGAIAPEAMG